MKNIAMKTAAAVVTGLFALGVMAPTATMAAEKDAKAEMKMDKKAMKAKAAPDPAVSALQEALNKNGAKLKVDGLMGGKTKAALKKYQKANGLKVTGMADAATKAKLGM